MHGFKRYLYFIIIISQNAIQIQSQIPDAPPNATIISLTTSNTFANVDIADCLYISLDIKLLSANHTNINQPLLQITDGNNEILLHISVLNSSLHLDNILNFALLFNVWYNISLYKTQQSLQYWINTQLIYSNDNKYPSHHLFTNVTLNIGNYSQDIILKNLYIWTSKLNQKENVSLSEDTMHIQIVLIGLLCGFILCLVIITVIVIFHCKALKRQKRKERNLKLNWRRNVRGKTVESKSLKKAVNATNVKEQTQTSDETKEEINLEMSDELTAGNDAFIQKHLSKQSPKPDGNHVQNLSVDFEDIRGITEGMPVPAYISDGGESESSTFTQSSTPM